MGVDRRSVQRVNVILFGATGMTGHAVLRECLIDPGIHHVLAIGRSVTGQRHATLREIAWADGALACRGVGAHADPSDATESSVTGQK